MSLDGYVFHQRSFLNRAGHYGLASVLVSLEKEASYPCATLLIADCGRTVEMSLNAFGKGSDESCSDFENSIEKLEILERAIKGLRMAMLKQAKANGYKKTREAK